MADGQKIQASMSEARVSMLMVSPVFMQVVTTPLFAAGEEQKLQADHATTVQSEGDSKRWRALAGWIDDPSKALVLCRKTELAINLGSALDPAIQLLPLANGSPSAEVVFLAAGSAPTPGATRQEQRLPMQVMLDVDRRMLKLVHSFEATDAGRTQYGTVVAAMSDPDAKTSVQIAYTHNFRRVVQHTAPPTRPPFQTPPIIVPREEVMLRARPVFAAATTPPPIARNFSTAAMAPSVMMASGSRATLAAAAAMPAKTIAQPAPAGKVMMMRNDRVGMADFRRVEFTPEQPANQPPTLEAATVAGVLRIDLFHRRDDVQIYPDEPRSQQNGWGQVPGREGKPALHFRDSARPDAFFYLPTAHKLGFYAETDGGIRPPMRAESYLDATGAYRVKVTLTSLPHIEAADREILRAHVRDVVLQRMLPFVQLELAAGLQPRFVGEFTAATPGGEQQALPAGIMFTALELVPDQRLILQFDMEAVSYTFFCELLRKGLRGHISLSAEGVQESIDVRLHLDDLVTNAVQLHQAGADAAAAQPTAAITAMQLNTQNMLDVPVTLSSLRVAQLDTGPGGMIFGAREQELLPQAGLRLEPAALQSLEVAAPTDMTDWNETVLVLGSAKVEGGSTDDWLGRVHRDASLQPQSFKLKATAVIPAAAAAQVQLLRLKLFREGEATARDSRDLPPGTTTSELAVPLSLAELAGTGGLPNFHLDVETLQVDGSLSLPQRLKVDLTRQELTLLALIETPGSVYTVDYEVPAKATGRKEFDRVGAAAFIADLASQGARWQVFARAAAAAPA